MKDNVILFILLQVGKVLVQLDVNFSFLHKGNLFVWGHAMCCVYLLCVLSSRLRCCETGVWG